VRAKKKREIGVRRYEVGGLPWLNPADVRGIKPEGGAWLREVACGQTIK
jgi:hypothetical protein